MKTKVKRKQTLRCRVEIPAEEEVSTMSTSYDPFLSGGNDKENYIPDEQLMNPIVWEMGKNSEVSNVPVDCSAASSLDLCPTSDLFIAGFDDVNAILEMDLNGSIPLFSDPDQENQDVFQDIKYTSTPKSRPLNVTSPNNQFESNSKRRRFHILHDITDTINSSNNESFININHVLDTTPPNQISHINDPVQSVLLDICTPPPSVLKDSENESSDRFSGNIRNVSIIRKKLQLRCTSNILTPDTTKSVGNSLTAVIDKPQKIESVVITPKSPSSTTTDRDKEELIYYSGISNYDVCLALLKHIKLCPSKHLSTFTKQMIMLMKLRLDLEWKDIAFRFNSREEIIRKVFLETLNVFSECLIELLPWHAEKRNMRKNAKSYLIHPIRRNDDQVVLIVGDSRKPITFVSRVCHKRQDPLLFVLVESSSNLVQGDTFSLDDTFFRIEEKDGTLCAFQKKNSSRHPNMAYQREIIANMLSLYPLKSLEAETDLYQLVIVLAALTNLNQLTSISLNTLKHIYEKSVNTCLQKQQLESI